MFCDLVGSTELSSRLDPEEIREIILAFQRSCARVVSGYGGFVAKYLGDGAWSTSATRERMRMTQNGRCAPRWTLSAIRRLQTPAAAPLHIRVGIATGLVVVGDLVGEGAAEERTVIGETPDSRLGCSPSPRRTVSSSPILPGVFSGKLSGSSTSVSKRSRASIRLSGAGSFRARLRRKAASTRGATRDSPDWSAAMRNEACCSTANGSPGEAKARSCSCLERRNREVAPDGVAGGAIAGRNLYETAPPMLALPLRQRALSLHRAVGASCGL